MGQYGQGVLAHVYRKVLDFIREGGRILQKGTHPTNWDRAGATPLSVIHYVASIIAVLASHDKGVTVIHPAHCKVLFAMSFRLGIDGNSYWTEVLGHMITGAACTVA